MHSPTCHSEEPGSAAPVTERRYFDIKPPAKDDLELLLLHEDFPKLLAMAAQVKALRSGGGTNVKDFTLNSFESLAAKDSLLALGRIQSKLLSSPSSSPVTPVINVFRGEHAVTDAILDEALVELQDELDAYQFEAVTQQPSSPTTDSLLLETLMAADSAALVPRPTPASSPSSSASSSHGNDSQLYYDPKRKGDAIAIKYSKWQTDIFMKWMIENAASPFPDTSDVAELALATGLTHSQVVNWTTNVRKRNLKATCKGSKKPHHFIDFLFLKQDREIRKSAVVCAAGQSILSAPPITGGSTEKPRNASRRRSAGDTSDRSVSSDPMSVRLKASHGSFGHQQPWFYDEATRKLELRLDEPVDELQLLAQSEIGRLEPLDWKNEEQDMIQRSEHHSELLEDFANYWEDDDEDSKYLLPAPSGYRAGQEKDLDTMSTHPPAKLPSFVIASSPVGRAAYRQSLLRSITYESHEDLPFVATPANKSLACTASIEAAPPRYYPKHQRPTSPPFSDYCLTEADEYAQLIALDEEHDDEYDWIKAWDIEEL
jgi:hypothetical protein